MSAIQLFNNGEFELSVEYIDDTFRVYGPHLARHLGVGNARDLVRHLEDDEKVQVRQGGSSPTLPDQDVWWVTEPGFFRAVSQRQAARIKDEATRDQVRRFQRWVFHDVLPAIRRHGHYEVAEPASFTWKQFSQILYQRYGLKLSVPQITSALRTAGVLCQDGTPRSKYADWFWMTNEGTVNVLSFTIVRVATKITETRMALIERLQWHQMRLELDGVGASASLDAR
jgi:prophage antirepressor-like protein